MLWLLPLLNTVAVAVTLGTVIYAAVVHYFMLRGRKLMPELAFIDGYLPVIGHISVFIHYCSNSATLWKHLNHYCEYYKDGFQGLLGHQLWIFMPEHHVLQEVLSSQETTDKCYVYQSLDLITDGVFIAPGYRWRKLRKRLNPTFSVKQIDSYLDAVNTKTEVFLNSVMRKVCRDGKYVDIQPYLSRFFFDVMTKTHYGVDTDEQVKNEFKVTESASTVIDHVIEERLLMPHLHIDFLFQFTDLYKKICKIRAVPLAFIESMIERRQKIVQENKDASDDIIVFVDQVAEVLKELNIPPTVHNIQRNSSDILIAGSDTTSITAASLLYFLALNKDIQERVYEEVSYYFGQDSYKPMTRQDFASMTYLDMALNEALRWSSPAGVIRDMNKDFDAGKYIIPKNSSVYCIMAAQHRNPAYYERVNEFYPEHFTPEAVKSRPKMAFIPFSYGPRNCPGKVFAYILIKAATAVMVNNYYLDTNLPLEDVKCKIILMTQHVQGYPIRLTPRQHTTPRG